MNILKYAVAMDADTGNVSLGIAFDLEQQVIALVQYNEDSGENDVVTVNAAALARCLEIVEAHMDKNGKLFDPNKENKIVN